MSSIIPAELVCPICLGLMESPVMLPCCATEMCHKCAIDRLSVRLLKQNAAQIYINIISLAFQISSSCWVDNTPDCASPLSEELLVPCIHRREKVTQYKQFSEYSSSETAVEWHVTTKAPLIDCSSTVKSNFAAQEYQATEAISFSPLKLRIRSSQEINDSTIQVFSFS